jgi:glycosyltransferase involved in cell wall biosynthesis
MIPKIQMAIQPFLMAATAAPCLQHLLDSGFRFQVIDAYYLYPDGVAAVVLARRFKVPVVLTAYGSDINVLPHYSIPRRLILWAANSADAITTVSHALSDECTKIGMPKGKIRVILNGVDLNLFRPPLDRPALRAELQLTDPTLLAVGNLVKLKGHELMLRALTLSPGIKLLIVGTGPEERTLMRQARRLGVSDRVKFLGYVDQLRLPRYYGAADALLHTSTSEGIPNVILEAMACGTPVIATDVGGVSEVVSDAPAGLLIHRHQPEAVAEAIREMLTASVDRGAVREYITRFSWSLTASRHLQVLHDVVVQHGHTAFGHGVETSDS